MSETRDRVFEAAEKRGLSMTKPVIVALNNESTKYKEVRFVVSHKEPIDITSPLNVMWVVSDPASPDFKKVMRRSSRSNSGSYAHAWSEVLREADLFVSQVWDLPEPVNQPFYDHISLIGNPHQMVASDIDAVAKSGGKLTGPLETRVLPSGEQPAMSEVVPRSFLESNLVPLRSITSSLQMFFSNLNNQVGSIRNRTTGVEGRMTTIEEEMKTLKTEAGESASKGFVHEQVEPASVWIIVHNLETKDIQVQVFEGNDLVWPASITNEDENTVRIRFAVPIIGSARIIPIA